MGVEGFAQGTPEARGRSVSLEKHWGLVSAKWGTGS